MVFSRGLPVEDLTTLLKDAREGGAQALQDLLRHFSWYISFCARRFFLSEEDRQDLMQEGRIALVRAVRRYNAGRGFFSPYAKLVIRRHMNRAAGKMIHVHLSEYPRLPEDLQELPTLKETQTPEGAVMERERRRDLARQMRKNLTTLESEVLSLFLEGLSYRQMAKRLHRPEKSVDNALRRIRAKVSSTAISQS